MTRIDLIVQLAGLDPESEEGRRTADDLRIAAAERLKRGAGIEPGSIDERAFAAEVLRRVARNSAEPVRLVAGTATGQSDKLMTGMLLKPSGEFLADAYFALESGGSPIMVVDVASFDKAQAEQIRTLRLADSLLAVEPIRHPTLHSEFRRLANPFFWYLPGAKWKHVRKAVRQDEDGFDEVVAYVSD